MFYEDAKNKKQELRTNELIEAHSILKKIKVAKQKLTMFERDFDFKKTQQFGVEIQGMQKKYEELTWC